MKSIDTVIGKITERLRTDWHLVAAGGQGRWPQTIPLGLPGRAVDLEADYDTVRRWSLDWQEWESRSPAEVIRTNRIVHGTNQRLPTHVLVNDAHAAARIVGAPWPQRLDRGSEHNSRLTQRFPNSVDLAPVIRAVDTYSDVDFGLLLDTASWFKDNDATGMTSRQVPIEGLHTKWLRTSQHLVALLAGKSDLGLIRSRPARVHYRYLDPDWAGRRCDLATVGDHTAVPLYPATTIVICENRDTAQMFPPLPAGISIEGDGLAAAGILHFFSWIRHCPNIFYWGDIDAAGYEILNSLRQSGVSARSILMDDSTYRKYEQFGTTIDENGNPIKCAARKELPMLTTTEWDVYQNLTDPGWTRVRRVEQEKMLLNDAVLAITHTPA
jgi:hypothetical protein